MITIITSPSQFLPTRPSISTKFSEWGRNVLDWDIDQAGKLNSSVLVGEKDYKGFSSTAPLIQKEFWANHTSLVKSFEAAGMTSPYRTFCYYDDETEKKHLWVRPKKVKKKALSDNECSTSALLQGNKIKPLLLFKAATILVLQFLLT